MEFSSTETYANRYDLNEINVFLEGNFSNPMFLNPALVGINQQGSAGINYRNQWPSINANFESYSFYSYYNFDDVSSSLGLILNSDREGLAGLYARSAAVQYAYQVRLNYNSFIIKCTTS